MIPTLAFISMDYFGYKFIGKSPEIDATRRSTLDWYANLAQLSQLLFILAILFGKFALAIVFNFLRNSNSLNYNVGKDRISTQKSSQEGKVLRLSRTTGDIEAFLGREVIKGYGTYEQWILGFGWAAWLGFLCINDTAPDYLHLVKRFGLIGASQLPIHYLLAMKHPYAPLRLLLKSSCRQLLSLHLISGRIIIFFVTLHAILYCSIFIRMNILGESIWQPKIAVALTSLAILGTIGITSTISFRRRAYPWFYRVHLIGSAIILPLLFFHVHHIRTYILESAAVIGLNALLRVFSNYKFNVNISDMASSSGKIARAYSGN